MAPSKQINALLAPEDYIQYSILMTLAGHKKATWLNETIMAAVHTELVKLKQVTIN